MINLQGNRAHVSINRTSKHAHLRITSAKSVRLISIRQEVLGVVAAKLIEVMVLSPDTEADELVESIEPLLAHSHLNRRNAEGIPCEPV
jgi:hypothetical protein